jgi:hypothetical protein
LAFVRIMRAMGSTRNRTWLNLTALAAALAAMLFLASGASLWHIDAPGSEAACTICHLAHMPALSGMPNGALAAPVVVAWIVLAETQAAYAAHVSLDSPPRAPPA